MNKIKLVGISLNPVLFDHIKEIFKQFNKKNLIYSMKSDSLNNHLIKIVDCGKIKKSNIFIYNTSVYNALLIFILKLRINKIFFHLHDPIPHSGILNPIIFLVNQLMVLLSDRVLVFSNRLKHQTEKYYFPKRVHVVQHGGPKFEYKKTEISDKLEITIGLVGRYMPYKGFKRFKEISIKYPKHHFYCIGDGYPPFKSHNLSYYKGYIEENRYYSLLTDLDYIFFGHKDVSFSGVLNDCVFLNKRLISPKESLRFLSSCDLSVKSISEPLNKQEKPLPPKNFGWEYYANFLKEIS